MNKLTRGARAAAVAACLAATGACRSDSPKAEPAAAPASTTASDVALPTPTAAGYTPVSDVTSHAAIGDDIAAIKKQLANLKEAKPVDWAAIKTAFATGGASKKGDGTNRTLAALVKAPEVVSYVNAAIEGGEGAEAVRAQRVEKGITTLLYLKTLDEIESAKTKVAGGKIDPKGGAPHNVDEAWAFYTANGNGVQSTAQKRGDDFKKPLDQSVLTALVATQAAASSGDSQAFATAQGTVRSALNHVFYLATYKYLDTGGDAGKRAEGESFYLAMAPTVKKAAPEADGAISAAFASGDAKAGRAALNTPAAITALELDPSQVIT